MSEPTACTGCLPADYAGAAKLAAWKKRVKTGWPSVRVEHVESSGVGDAAKVGALLSVRIVVCLGELTPADVHVQVLHGKDRQQRRARRRYRAGSRPGREL